MALILGNPVFMFERLLLHCKYGIGSDLKDDISNHLQMINIQQKQVLKTHLKNDLLPSLEQK